MDEIKADCLIHLLGMSTKRIMATLEGKLAILRVQTVKSNIEYYFESSLQFSESQYGCRPKKSTGFAIFEFVKNCIYSLDMKHKVVGGFYDMSKV